MEKLNVVGYRGGDLFIKPCELFRSFTPYFAASTLNFVSQILRFNAVLIWNHMKTDNHLFRWYKWKIFDNHLHWTEESIVFANINFACCPFSSFSLFLSCELSTIFRGSACSDPSSTRKRNALHAGLRKWIWFCAQAQKGYHEQKN